jgi:hypothetical protein
MTTYILDARRMGGGVVLDRCRARGYPSERWCWLTRFIVFLQ